MREIVNPVLAKEVQLDRPPRTFGERLFRFSLYFLIVASALGWIAEEFRPHKWIGEALRIMIWPFAITYLLCFFYTLVYAGYRYTPRRRVTWKIWLLILGVPVAALIAFVLPK